MHRIIILYHEFGEPLTIFEFIFIFVSITRKVMKHHDCSRALVDLNKAAKENLLTGPLFKKGPYECLTASKQKTKWPISKQGRILT